MAQTQLAFKSEEFSFTERLSNTFRQSTIAQISQYLGENDFTVKGTISALLPAISNLLLTLEPNSRELSKFSALITNYRESLGNYNLNNIGIENFNHLNDIGTNDLTDLFGINLTRLLDSISKVTGLKQESTFTLLALLFPYILKQVGSTLPKGINFNPALTSFLNENQEIFILLEQQATPKLSNIALDYKKNSTNLFLYFFILSVSAFFIFNGLTYFSANNTGYKNTYLDTMASINKVEKALLTKLTGLVRRVLKRENHSKNENVQSKVEDSLNVAFDPKNYPEKTSTDIATQVNQYLSNSKDTAGVFNLSGIKFAFGSSDLTDVALAVIDSIVPVLVGQDDLHIELSGHTDNSGVEEVNKALSKSRAEAVAKIFIEKGVPARSIQTMGYGSSRPIATNTTLEGRYLNRRIEMLIVRKK